MPRVTIFNLRKDDNLFVIEGALRGALVSIQELNINADEIDLVPVVAAEGFHGAVVRIDVDLWERAERTKAGLQELATRVARSFQEAVGRDRRVTVVIRPYDVGKSGWVSL